MDSLGLILNIFLRRYANLRYLFCSVLFGSSCIFIFFQNFYSGSASIQLFYEFINGFLFLIIFVTDRTFQIHLNITLSLILIELANVFILHGLVNGLTVIHPLEHLLELHNLVLVLLQQGVLWILIHLWLVLDCLRARSVSQCR